MIVGECGDGKSTLINGLRDRRISGEAKTGLLANGVTKDVEAYIGQLSRDQLAVYLDTPGFGDGSVSTVTLVSQLEKQLKEGVNGIIVTTPATACRFKLSMRIARLLIEIGFEDADKWDRVVLVGTKADLATSEEKALFDISHDTGIAGQFFQGTAGCLTALTTKSDTSKLRDLLLKVSSKRIHYVAPTIDQLSEALGAELGVTASSVVAELREKRHEALQIIGQMAAEKEQADTALRTARAQLVEAEKKRQLCLEFERAEFETEKQRSIHEKEALEKQLRETREKCNLVQQEAEQKVRRAEIELKSKEAELAANTEAEKTMEVPRNFNFGEHVAVNIAECTHERKRKWANKYSKGLKCLDCKMEL